MSCNGCRVLRKGCSESCILRPCLDWIKSGQCQANATAFLAKFYGRKGLINLITNGPQYSRPALFRSLLYEACGRILNPIYGSVGLLWSGNWALCQAGVESILQGSYPVAKPSNTCHDPNEKEHRAVHAGALMQRIASELHKVKTRGKFKLVNPSRKPKSIKEAQLLNSIQISSGEAQGKDTDIRKPLQEYNGIFGGKDYISSANCKCSSEVILSQQPHGLDGEMNYINFHTLNQPKVEVFHVQTSEVEVELELELRLGGQGCSSAQTPAPVKLAD